MGEGVERRVRAICSALPGVTERPSHGAPAWFAQRQFVQCWPHGHHEHDFPHLWCAAAPGVAEALSTVDPARYFRPPYVGGRGWVGMRLDGACDWDDVAERCEHAFRLVAPVHLVAALDAGRVPPPSP